MELTNIKKATLSTQAYEEIRKAIILRTLKPNDTLTEEKLSAELGISRTPIRTALQQLVHDGFAQLSSNNSICVTQLSEQDIYNISLVRNNLEALAIQSLPENCSGLADDLASICEQQKKVIQSDAPDYLRYIDLDYQFHTLIAQASQNKFLYDMVCKINMYSTQFFSLPYTLENYSNIALEEHLNIMEYIKKRQLEHAALAMKDHIMHINH